MIIRTTTVLCAVLLLGCPPSGDADDSADTGGIVTFTIDGTTYTTEMAGGGGVQADGFLQIAFQDDPDRGDLGVIRGNINLSSGYTGPGSYGPLDSTTPYGSNVTVRLPGGGEDGWEGPPQGTAGDGSIEVDSDDGVTVEGTLSWTAYLWDAPETSTPITGTFSVASTEQRSWSSLWIEHRLFSFITKN